VTTSFIGSEKKDRNWIGLIKISGLKNKMIVGAGEYRPTV
jgi:hypothetical protein